MTVNWRKAHPEAARAIRKRWWRKLKQRLSKNRALKHKHQIKSRAKWRRHAEKTNAQRREKSFRFRSRCMNTAREMQLYGLSVVDCKSLARPTFIIIEPSGKRRVERWRN